MIITVSILFALVAVLGIWLWHTRSKVDDLLDVIHKVEENTSSSLQYIRRDIGSLQHQYETARKQIDGGVLASTEKYAWTRQKANQIEENKNLLTELIIDLGYELDIVGPQPARPARFKLKKPEQRKIKSAAR